SVSNITLCYLIQVYGIYATKVKRKHIKFLCQFRTTSGSGYTIANSQYLFKCIVPFLGEGWGTNLVFLERIVFDAVNAEVFVIINFSRGIEQCTQISHVIVQSAIRQSFFSLNNWLVVLVVACHRPLRP